MKNLVLLTLITFGHTPIPLIAKSKKPPVDTARTLAIQYGSAPWNLDSKKIDTAYIFMRDSRSGKILKILLEETTPDSAQFKGVFSISWARASQVKPEIYIPPKNLRKNNADKFIQKIQRKTVQRKPVIFKKQKSGVQVLDVYDTRSQAKKALEAYKKQKKLERIAKSKVKQIPKEEELEVSKQLKKEQLLNQLAQEASKRELDRLRLEQIASQQIQQLRSLFSKLSPAEKKRRQQKAKSLADQALKLYKKGKYTDAEGLFRKSWELDPFNMSYYFQFGVCLYRVNKYNEALVIFNTAEPNPLTDLEKKYYQGLSHFRLKELDLSLINFIGVKKSQHKVLSPSAAFYEGLILYGQEKYEQAQAPFEYVIDTSTDPKMDTKAEEYLELIAKQISFQKIKKRKHSLSLSSGFTYDSNILVIAENQISTNSFDEAGTRLLMTGEYDYRWMHKMNSEFSTNVSTYYIYSLDDTFSRADPFLLTLTAPYTWKGVWKNRGYKLSASPGYELLKLDADDDGSPENLLNSIYAYSDLTLVMSQKWFANYNLELRNDDSLATDSVGTNDADALKISLSTTQTYFIDDTKKRAYIGSTGLILNQASGDEKSYQRLDLGISYLAPVSWWPDYNLTSSLNYQNLNFADSSTGRKDNQFALSSTLSHSFSKTWSWSLTAAYTNNASNVDDNDYDKYSLTALFTYEWLK